MSFEKKEGHFERDNLGRFKKGTIPPVKIKKRKCEEKFDSIDNSKKAYWFGFLTGDGSIGVYGNGRYRLKLSITDKEHLKKFMIFLGYGDSKIYEYDSICEFKVDNEKIVKHLFDLGLSQNKTNKNSGRLIPYNFKKDFIRGLFDADGCINLFTPPKCEVKNAEFHICGTKKLLSSIKKILTDNIEDVKSKNGSLVEGKGCYCLEYKGRWLVEKIGYYLYSDAKIFLERKYETFKGLFKYNNNQPRKYDKLNEEDVWEIKELYWKNKLSQKQIADKFEVSQGHISRIINEKRYDKYGTTKVDKRKRRKNELKYSKETYLRAVELSEEGLGYKKIGQILDISPWTVREWINRNNLPLRIKELLQNQNKGGD